MTCKYCNGKLAPLRSLTDGEFCSDAHREAFLAERARPEASPAQALQREAVQREAVQQDQPLATAFDSGPVKASAKPARDAVLAEPVESLPSDSSLAPSPVQHAAQSFAPPEPPRAEASPVADTPAATPQRARWHFDRHFPGQWLATAWRTAPTDLRVMALLLPVLAGVALALTAPGRHIHFSQARSNAFRARARQAISQQWQFLEERIANRAAIAITDDFRSGLDSWRGRANLTNTWSYDSNGFVQPGPLAVLKPTEDLRDYTFEFLGEIEQRAVGCAFRASDLDNYYAVKFIQVDSGSIPTLRLVRYAVIKGKEGPHVEKTLPSSIRADMLNRFRVEVHGSDFTVLVQGEVVDFFTDQRLPSGGVGFFCSRGERARLRWVQVSHQYDTLGRLCAFLAPVGLAGVDKD